jgi:ATP-dependent protease ClpP protease subunit
MNQIDIYGDIGESMWDDSISALDVKTLLNDMEGDITVRINSGGGSVFDGFAIYNLLDQHEGEIHVKIDALAASAASVVAMAGDTVEMADNALFMIHNPWTMALGESKDMIKTAELLDKIRDSIVTTYQSKANLGTGEISDMMDEETWLSADEAIENGFVTAKTGEQAIMNKVNKPWMNKAPDVSALKQAEEKTDQAFLNVQRRKLKLLADA